VCLITVDRLEFLGDAILDYIITRHLYEDSKKHSPGMSKLFVYAFEKLCDLQSDWLGRGIHRCI